MSFPPPALRQRRLELLSAVLSDAVFRDDATATFICQKHVDREEFSIIECVAELCHDLARRLRAEKAEARRLRVADRERLAEPRPAATGAL